MLSLNCYEISIHEVFTFLSNLVENSNWVVFYDGREQRAEPKKRTFALSPSGVSGL